LLGCNRFSESFSAKRKIFLVGTWSGFKLLPQALIYTSFSAEREMRQNSFF
jgi:hypothetical protein